MPMHDAKLIKVRGDVYEKLTKMRRAAIKKRGAMVTFSEVIGMLLEGER